MFSNGCQMPGDDSVESWNLKQNTLGPIIHPIYFYHRQIKIFDFKFDSKNVDFYLLCFNAPFWFSQRNGADYAVFLNTASEFDGSDSGARPDEAKSWGKIKKEATPVKIYAEATLILPLLVGETFAKDFFNKK